MSGNIRVDDQARPPAIRYEWDCGRFDNVAAVSQRIFAYPHCCMAHQAGDAFVVCRRPVFFGRGLAIVAAGEQGYRVVAAGAETT